MKKLLLILVLAVLAVACEVEGGLRRMTIDNIYINPTNNPNGGWTALWLGPDSDPYFDCMYADIPMPEITSRVAAEGMFFTYFKYNDSQTGTLVQEGEGLTIFNIEKTGYDWSYTVNCEYSVGNMRITIRTSDFQPYIPAGRMEFRTVIIY